MNVHTFPIYFICLFPFMQSILLKKLSEIWDEVFSHAHNKCVVEWTKKPKQFLSGKWKSNQISLIYNPIKV